jgi:hypothetical protein
MSKLTETLTNQMVGQLKNVSIKFDAELLDQSLLDKLGDYLSTKSSRKLIEFSFTIVSTKKLDIQHSIIEQIQYKPAKQLLETLSQKPKVDTEKKIQRVYVPRWMVLVVGKEVSSMNGRSPVTVEDAINTVFRLCLNFLEKTLGNDGQATEKAG